MQSAKTLLPKMMWSYKTPTYQRSTSVPTASSNTSRHRRSPMHFLRRSLSRSDTSFFREDGRLPTLEEIVSHTDDNYARLRQAFLSYSKRYLFEENVLFLLDYGRFLCFVSHDVDDAEGLVLERAQAMVDKYIEDGSPYQLNIPHKLQVAVQGHNAALDTTGLEHAFTMVSEHVRNNLEQQVFVDFLTEQYEQYERNFIFLNTFYKGKSYL
jgi:hypothetical protein